MLFFSLPNVLSFSVSPEPFLPNILLQFNHFSAHFPPPPPISFFHISAMTGLAAVLLYLRKVFPVWLMIQDSGAIRQGEAFFIGKNVICKIYTLLNKQDANKKGSHLLNALKCHMSLISTMTAGLSIHLTFPGAPWEFEREELCVGVLWCTVWQASCHCQH